MIAEPQCVKLWRFLIVMNCFAVVLPNLLLLVCSSGDRGK